MSAQLAHNGPRMPRMNISLSGVERARLERLARRWGVPYSRALAMAVTHALESLQRGEVIHTVDADQEDD